MRMKKQVKFLLLTGLLVFTFSIISSQVVQAKPYWDSKEGAYIVKVYNQPRKGNELYYIGQNQFKQAVLKKYKTIDKNATYYFNFTNVVKQAHITSMKGYIRDVVCVSKKN